MAERRPGGIYDAEGAENSLALKDLAIFAVEEYNKKANASLKFARVVMAKEQLVAGTIYYVIFVAIEREQKKLCGAKVVVELSNRKGLEAFKIFDVVNLAAN